MGAQDWADQTAQISDLGLRDILIAVAVKDRAYAYSLDQDFPLTNDELNDVMMGCSGINGDPAVAKRWRDRTMPDDPRVLSNVRGTVAFAFKDPNGRSAQVFINLKDNSATHDAEPFVPFARVIEGMEVADAWYAEYGERAGGGIRAGRQDPVFEGGNAYLLREFPKLDYIKRAVVLEQR